MRSFRFSTAAAVLSLTLSCGPGGGGEAARTAQPKEGAEAAGTAPGRPRDLETFVALVDYGVYKSKVAPAFDRYVNSGDDSAVRQLMPGTDLPEAADRKQRLEAALKLAPPVVEAKCLVRIPGIEPYQLGGSSELVSYLYSASDWLRETLTSKDISDVTLDYPIGEHTEIIRPAEAAEIRVNVRNAVPPEDAAIKKQLAAFLKMMAAVGQNPNYSVALIMK